MKKICAILFALMIVVSALSVSALAAGDPQLTVTTDKSVVKEVGEIINVTVTLDNAAGVTSIGFDLSYPGFEFVTGSNASPIASSFMMCQYVPATQKFLATGAMVPLADSSVVAMTFQLKATSVGDSTIGISNCQIAVGSTKYTPSGVPAQISHDHVWGEAVIVNPTCKENGSETRSCTVSGCDKTDVKDIPSTGEHDWVKSETVDPTCDEKGYTTYTCSGCTETKVEDEPATGHKEETVAAKAATCTEDGLTEGKKCSVCGVITEKQTVVSATGHTDLVTEGAKEATCTEAGSTGTAKCNACGTQFDAAEEIPALGHIGGEACCVELAVCERCGESYGELNPNSHCTYVWAEAWAGSCTSPSSDAYIYCEDCLTWWVIPEGFTYEDLCDEAFDVSELGEAAGVLEDEFTVPEELIGDLNPDNHYCYESDEDYHWTTCEFGNGEREEHNWSDWEKADNYKYRYCWDCGYWDEVEISASATSPKTGDEANIALWIVMALACGAGAVLTLKKREN